MINVFTLVLRLLPGVFEFLFIYLNCHTNNFFQIFNCIIAYDNFVFPLAQHLL